MLTESHIFPHVGIPIGLKSFPFPSHMGWEWEYDFKPMGIPICGNLWDFLWGSVGFPGCFCEILCVFLWDFLWASLGFSVGLCGNSHRNLVGMECIKQVRKLPKFTQKVLVAQYDDNIHFYYGFGYFDM